MKSNSDYYSHFGKMGINEYFQKNIITNSQEINRFQSIFSHLPRDSSSLLDIGSGSGFFLHLAQQNNLLHSAGIEPIKSKIKFIKNHFNLEGIVADAGHLPVKDASFDTVSALEVLEHLSCESFSRTLDEIQRVAKKNIIISVPYNEQRFNIVCPECECEFNPNYHMRSFDEKKLKIIFPHFRNIVLEKNGKTKKSIIPFEILTHSKYIFPELAVCPLCGYRRSDSAKMPTMTGTMKMSSIGRIIPKKTSYRWIIGVYQKC